MLRFATANDFLEKRLALSRYRSNVYAVTRVRNNPESPLLPSFGPFGEFAASLRPTFKHAFVHVMLRARLPSVKLFHALIESAFNIVGVSPVNLRFNNDGMSLQATSSCKIGLLHVVLARTAFDYYQCPVVTIIGVNCQSLLSALKLARHNDRITLMFNHNDTATTADARAAAGASILRLRFDEDDAHIIGCFQFYCAQVAVDDLIIPPESEFAYNGDMTIDTHVLTQQLRELKTNSRTVHITVNSRALRLSVDKKTATIKDGNQVGFDLGDVVFSNDHAAATDDDGIMDSAEEKHVDNDDAKTANTKERVRVMVKASEFRQSFSSEMVRRS